MRRPGKALNRGFNWEREEDARAVSLRLAGLTCKEVARELGRTEWGVRSRTRGAARAAGVRSAEQGLVLAALRAAAGPLTRAELCAALDTTNLQTALAALLSRGLAARRRDPREGRRYVYSLPAGGEGR